MLKETGCLACFSIMCHILHVQCGVLDADCRNSVVFVIVLECLLNKKKKSSTTFLKLVRDATRLFRIPVDQRHFLNSMFYFYVYMHIYTLLCKAR